MNLRVAGNGRGMVFGQRHEAPVRGGMDSDSAREFRLCRVCGASVCGFKPGRGMQAAPGEATHLHTGRATHRRGGPERPAAAARAAVTRTDAARTAARATPAAVRAAAAKAAAARAAAARATDLCAGTRGVGGRVMVFGQRHEAWVRGGMNALAWVISCSAAMPCAGVSVPSAALDAPGAHGQLAFMLASSMPNSVPGNPAGARWQWRVGSKQPPPQGGACTAAPSAVVLSPACPATLASALGAITAAALAPAALASKVCRSCLMRATWPHHIGGGRRRKSENFIARSGAGSRTR
jgi:hypothetical protein